MLDYRRHRNGSGKLYGEESVFVSSDSYVDRESAVCGDSHISSSRISKSLIIDSTIHRGTLQDVKLNRVVVDGTVSLVGPWELSGPAYIRSGVWRRSPKHLILAHESGIHVGLTESTNGRAFIACNERSVEDWLKFGIRIGLHLKWPRELCEQAYRFMEELYESRRELAA